MKMDNLYNKYANYIRVYCRCGHSLAFLRNHSAICNNCGRTVYPTKKCEFKEKTEKELRKMKVRNNELCNFKG